MRQIVIMFCYLAIGYFLYRYQLITKEGSRSLANLLLYGSLPWGSGAGHVRFHALLPQKATGEF